MHYTSDHIRYAGAHHLTRACIGVMWGCWHRVDWPNSPRPAETERERRRDREGERGRERVGLKSDTQQHWLGVWLLLLIQPYVPASLAVMAPQTKRLSNSLHGMWSKRRKTNSKCFSVTVETMIIYICVVCVWRRSQGKHEIQHWRPKGTSVSGNSNLRRWFSISQHANLSLFKLAKYSPAVTRARPRHKYTGSGVGSSVKARSVCYWHAPPPCLSAARQWTPRCCKVPYCCCQHSHTAAAPRCTQRRRITTCNKWYTTGTEMPALF